MKLTVNLAGLENLRRKMGAKERLWMPDDTIREIRINQQKVLEGVPTNLESVTVSNGGLLSYEGLQVVVYIKDHTNNFGHRESVLKNPENGNRIHVYDCNVLEQMRQNKRYERYVQTAKTKDFEIDIKSSSGVSTESANLKVCQICLKTLRYNNYNGGKTDIWRNFDLEEFFGEYSTFFAVTPRYHDFASPSYDYTKNWSNRSREVRTRYSWTCAECKVVLSRPEHRKYLHTHHQNGIKSDNSNKNLIPLCAICHAKEPSHQHMIVSDEVRRIIEALRLK